MSSCRLHSPAWAALALLVAGCETTSQPDPLAAKPNFAPMGPDVRTDATIQAMENQYIAEKNSQPTHQYQAEQKKKKKEEAAKAAKAAQEAKEKAAEAGK